MRYVAVAGENRYVVLDTHTREILKGRFHWYRQAQEHADTKNVAEVLRLVRWPLRSTNTVVPKSVVFSSDYYGDNERAIARS